MSQLSQISNSCCGCMSNNLALLSPEYEIIQVYRALVIVQLESKMKQIDDSLIQFCMECITLLRRIREFQVKCSKSADVLLAQIIREPEKGNTIVLEAVKQEELELDDDDDRYFLDESGAPEVQPLTKVEVEVSDIKQKEFEAEIPIEIMCEVRSKRRGIPKRTRESPKKFKKEMEEAKNTEGYCPFCQISFPTHKLNRNVVTFKVHILREHTFTNGPTSGITCKLCNTSISSKKTITQHFRRKHITENETLQCAHCENYFRNRYSLKSHVQMYHLLEPRKFTCDLCQRDFKKKLDIHRHMIKKHICDRICELCQMTFRDKDQYKNHKSECKATFMCHICGTKLQSKLSLKNHVIGQHVAPPPCTICGQEFPRKQDLDHHIVIEHTEKTFTCDLCGKSYHSQNGLNSHVKFTHLKIENKYARQKQFCNVCKKWESSTTKNNHELKAKLGRRYQCDECELSFFHAHQLKRHKYTHTKLRPYNCKLCEAGYYHVSYLKAHYQRTHGSEYLGAIIK